MKTIHNNYKEQYKEVKKLIDSIETKCFLFATMPQSTPYYDDLNKVISELKEINSFLK